MARILAHVSSLPGNRVKRTASVGRREDGVNVEDVEDVVIGVP